MGSKNRWTTTFCTLLAMAVLAGCGWAQYEEASSLPPYAGSIGKKYRTQRHLELLGITDDPNYRPRIDYFLVKGKPSISGPEVIERRPLPAGSLMEVVRIMRCTNCPFSSIRFEVRISPEDALGNRPVYVENLGKMLVVSADGSTALNPDVFESISN